MIASLTSAVVFAEPGDAQPAFWRRCDGPFGGIIHGIAMDSAHAVYAVGDGGIFRTVYQALTWQRLNFPEGFFAAPASIDLGQNFPNPFNGRTVVQLYLPVPSQVRVDVFNELGQLVERVRDGWIEGGQHLITWNAPHLPSGVYFICARAGGLQRTRGVVLVR